MITGRSLLISIGLSKIKSLQINNIDSSLVILKSDSLMPDRVPLCFDFKRLYFIMDLCKYCFRYMNSYYLNTKHIHICKSKIKCEFID